METATRFLRETDIKTDPVLFRELFAEIRLAAAFLRDNSPYPEVRASVSNIDDPEMPALTFRVWFIGASFLGSATRTNLD